MKKLSAIFLSVFLLLSIKGWSQVYSYHSLPDSNIIWEGYNVFGAMGSSFAVGFIYKTIGDTTINSIRYQKITKGSFDFALLREDTSKRIYFIDPTDSAYQERLVCDFSLGLGDTMYSGQNFFVITAIDTVNYLGTLRRTFSVKINTFLNNRNKDVWIEGIGCTSTPIGRLGPCSSCLDAGICKVYIDSTLSFESCPFLYQSLSETYYDPLVTVFPNPATISFTLQLSTAPNTPTYFQLYDAIGRQVRQEEIIAASTTLNRNNLPKGIYFWQLLSEHKVLQRGKLVME